MFSGVMAVLCLTSLLILPLLSVPVAVAWIAAFCRFCSIKYEVFDKEIQITAGVVIKSEKRLELRGILWRSRIKLCGAVLTVLHTSGGVVFLFADCNL